MARLPIHDELTLALVGRVSRLLIPVRGSTGCYSPGMMKAHTKEMSYEHSVIAIL
jgi:hypothetical protein